MELGRTFKYPTSRVPEYPTRNIILGFAVPSIVLMYSMQHGDTGLRAPYVDTLRAPYIPLGSGIPQRVVGVLVGGDMLCCHPPSGLLTGPLYEEG